MNNNGCFDCPQNKGSIGHYAPSTTAKIYPCGDIICKKYSITNTLENNMYDKDMFTTKQNGCFGCSFNKGHQGNGLNGSIIYPCGSSYCLKTFGTLTTGTPIIPQEKNLEEMTIDELEEKRQEIILEISRLFDERFKINELMILKKGIK